MVDCRRQCSIVLLHPAAHIVQHRRIVTVIVSMEDPSALTPIKVAETHTSRVVPHRGSRPREPNVQSCRSNVAWIAFSLPTRNARNVRPPVGSPLEPLLCTTNPVTQSPIHPSESSGHPRMLLGSPEHRSLPGLEVFVPLSSKLSLKSQYESSGDFPGNSVEKPEIRHK